MKNLSLLLIISLSCLGTLFGQVTKVNYVLHYNCESNLYEVKLKILEGSATSIPHRAQFNAQIAMVVPTGVTLEMVENINPINNNQNYDGTVPIVWSKSSPAVSPAEMPESDFHAISPTLAPASFYNNLEEGSEVTLFTCRIGDSDEYNSEYRFYNNNSDPNVNGNGGYRNGFTLGSPNQIYNDNEYSSCTTSTKDHQWSSIKVYPSPFSQGFNVELTEDAEAISVIDYSGKQVYSSGSHAKGIVTIDANHLPSGIYMVHVKTVNSSSVRRVVKN